MITGNIHTRTKPTSIIFAIILKCASVYKIDINFINVLYTYYSIINFYKVSKYKIIFLFTFFIQFLFAILVLYNKYFL